MSGLDRAWSGFMVKDDISHINPRHSTALYLLLKLIKTKEHINKTSSDYCGTVSPMK